MIETEDAGLAGSCSEEVDGTASYEGGLAEINKKKLNNRFFLMQIRDEKHTFFIN